MSVVTLPPTAGLAADRPLPLGVRLWRAEATGKLLVLVLLVTVWELIARLQGNPLLLPTFSATLRALVAATLDDDLLGRVWLSLSVLLQGYLIGSALAFVLTAAAVSNRFGRDLLALLTAMLNPLPAIALLPLAMMWFGLGRDSLVFVLVHAVLWPLALAMFQGFLAVPETLRMAGRNYGLRGTRYVVAILVPAALPSILAGLKIGWAFAWRTLIAAELVFGASSGQGGLGWYNFQSRNELLIDQVFAGLAAVILIGLLVENLLFRAAEAVTVRRWGMLR